MTQIVVRLAARIGFFGILCAASPVSAQVAPSLGSAQSFAVLGGSTVTNTGSTVITGDLGVSPGSSATGFPPGTVVSGTIHTADSAAQAAQAAAATAYGSLASQACTQDLTGQDLGGLTLTPGVYCFSSTAQLTGTLTLNALGSSNAVFIFKIGSALTTASGSSVVLINSGSACNVFWQVGSSATLGTSSALSGNILAQTSITATTGAQVTGRTLALNGAVTLDTARVTVVCGSAPLPPQCPTISLSPATLPNGTVGAAYTQTLVAGGGTAPYTYAVTAGVLPAGMTLSAAGVLSGTPTSAGQTSVTIRATDANGCSVTIVYSITIAAAAACPTISATPSTLPNGRVAVAYSQTIVGSGGTAPYTYAVTAGALPAGLTLTAQGVLAGTPTTAGETSVTIRVTDANGCFVDLSYTITVAAAAVPPAGCPPIALTPATLPNGTVAVAYSQTLLGSGGTAPYTYAVIGGALPAGMTLTAGGVLAGTPTAAGATTATIRVTDVNGCFVEVTYTITIVAAAAPPPGCPPISLTPAALPNGTVGVAYSQTIVGSGGTAPYTFGITFGALPDGLTLTAAGVVAGTPTTAAQSSVTIRGTDANGCFAELPYTMSIVTAVPTLPQAFAILLALTLAGVGYLRLRRAGIGAP